MSILRKVVSLGHWLLDSEKSMSDFKKNTASKEEDLIIESPHNKLMSPLVITAHVFYPEFATQLIQGLKQLPRETKVFATTPSKDIKKSLDVYLDAAGHPHDVRITPNVGRNFGPLLVEFSKQLLREESFIHVHSKKSIHSPGIAKDWLDRNRELFLTKEGIGRITSITEANQKIGLLSVDASDLLRGINFRWGRSKKIAKKMLRNLPEYDEVKWSGKISFPAGGMFWVRTDAVRPLLEMDWKYSFFPKENGQQDGTLHHSIERAVGELCVSREYYRAHLVLKTDSFYYV